MRDCSDKAACKGLEVSTPVAVHNPVGLPSLVRRVGVHGQFKSSMLARIALSSGILESFDARTDDDWTVAYLDATSAALDVLTFYSERISNEAYLRTFTERRSAVELARLVGYQPRPGVAASTVLAFTLEETPGAPSATLIPAGFKVQSTPGQGETPQTFETSDGIVARRGYGAIRPRRNVPQTVSESTETLFVEGVANAPKVGDGLLFRAGNKLVFGIVSESVGSADGTHTQLRIASKTTLDDVAGLLPAPGSPLVGTIAASLAGLTKTQVQLEREASDSDVDLEALFKLLNGPLPGQSDPPPPNVRLDVYADAPSASIYVFRARSGLFGAGALDLNELPNVHRFGEYIRDKTDFSKQIHKVGPYGSVTAWADSATADEVYKNGGLHLDSVQPAFAAGTPVVLVDGATCRLYSVTGNAEVSHRQFGVSAKVSRVALATSANLSGFKVRTTAVYGAPEKLRLARVAPSEEIPSNDFYVEGFFRYLKPGGWVTVEGSTVDEPSLIRSDAIAVAEVTYVFPSATQQGGTRVKLSRPLTHRFLAAASTINANVTLATHGETVEEILGGGDGRRAFQRFELRQTPVTYVGGTGDGGAASTLAVYVSGVRWQEVLSLSAHGPDDKVYVTELDDEGKRTVMFGDGRNGARLPSGQENVRARYRRGLGSGGNLKAGQIDVPLSRPPGLRAAHNPIAAKGGDDPDSREAIRRNLPLGLTTLGRVVSLKDYGEFALAFSGIAKARADWVWTGSKREILVSVVGPRGETIDPGGELAQRLLRALKDAGDASIPVRIGSVSITTFGIEGTVKVEPDRRIEDVRKSVEGVLRDRLSFDAREIGQPVFPSEIVAWIQAVPGVAYVDLDRLVPRSGSTTAEGTILPSVAGSLILLDPAPLALEVSQ